MSFRDFLGGPVVTTLRFTVGSVSSIPGQNLKSHILPGVAKIK